MARSSIKPSSSHSPKKTKHKRGVSALWIVATLFAASGVLRLGNHGLAIANEVSALTQTASTDKKPETCQSEEDITRVLTLLDARENKLKKREADLENRLQALAVAETQVKQNMAALVEAENALKSTMALADGAAEKDLTRLTEVYENMKPKQAIPLFAQMDPQFAAGFLGRMRSDIAAQILAGLKPEKSYAISVILASRNARVPTN